jgi:PIN domain nuclease of toxin-antitoxin system
MKFLLDTCTFLWLISGAQELPDHIASLIRTPEHDVYLSAASAWEIALKHSLGRLPLPAAPARFVLEQREGHAVASLPIDEESALHVTRLPHLHRDPFDRMLASQAIVHGLTILTPDPLVSQYPARSIW